MVNVKQEFDHDFFYTRAAIHQVALVDVSRPWLTIVENTRLAFSVWLMSAALNGGEPVCSIHLTVVWVARWVAAQCHIFS